MNLKGRKPINLLNFLKSRHERCEGPVTVDDVRDTIPKAKADKIIQVNLFFRMISFIQIDVVEFFVGINRQR